ncbi:SMI1/KNR4 family protein, partial [Salmonella enterica]|nr:SMI1/KNR4 family protein [Salmonella enterica]
WDHEVEVDEGETPDMSNVYLINESFSDFINNLYEEVI